MGKTVDIHSRGWFKAHRLLLEENGQGREGIGCVPITIKGLLSFVLTTLAHRCNNNDQCKNNINRSENKNIWKGSDQKEMSFKYQKSKLNQSRNKGNVNNELSGKV